MSTRTPRTSKRILAAIAAAGIVATTFAIASPTQATQAVVESRVAGLDRYATAAQVAQATFPAPNANIILASGQNFPDGLASAGLAGAANAPVLLTEKDALPGVTQNALAAVFGSSATKTVHIVGGEAAISAAVAAQVTSLGYTVNRIAGADRYDTAAKIAAFQATLAPVGLTRVAGVPLRTAIVATGENFPDALSGGAPAFRGKHPVLLTATSALPAATSAALTSLGIQRVILLGGDTAVVPAVATQIATLGSGIRVDRVSGADRGATAAALANILVATEANGGFDFYGTAAAAACLGTGVTGPNIALIVSGNTFADALAAGPHGGVCKAPVLISGSASTATFLTANAAKVGVVRAIGGLNAVPAADLTAAKTAATAGTPTSVLTINQGNPVIKVDFSTAIVGTGDVKVNNGADLCPGAALTALPAAGAALTVGQCYLVTANSVTTLWTPNVANLNVGDTVVVSGFLTSAATGSLAAATASSTIPATPAQLTGAITGAIVSGTAPTVTFNRPVGFVGGAADVTIVKAAAPTVIVNLGPLTFPTGLSTQLATTATIALGGAAPLTAGDVITVKRTAVAGVVGAASLNLLADVTAVVQSAGAAPALSAATGVLTSSGGILLTNTAVDDTNVVVQAKSALPAGAVVVAYDGATNAGTNSVATTAAAVLNNTTGVTTITVKLGTNATGVINATAQQVATAINTGASATATATASNPLSLTVVPAPTSTAVGAGSRTVAVTGTATKPLSAINAGLMTYDGNNDGFADPGVGAPTLTTFTGTAVTPSSTFVVTFNLGVGTLPTNTGASFTAGTSRLQAAPGSLTDATAVPSTGQIIPIAAP